MTPTVIPLSEVPRVVKHHSEALLPLVVRLCDLSGFVEEVEGDGRRQSRLTELGRSSIAIAHQVAMEASIHLEAIVGGHATPTEAHQAVEKLGRDASELFAVLEAALEGLGAHPDPFRAAAGITSLLYRLALRCKHETMQEAVIVVLWTEQVWEREQQVSRPIEAPSDDAAIAALISESGGRADSDQGGPGA